jgi:hypothetical protein
MEAIRIIQRHKKLILVLEIICLVFFAAELLYLRQLGTFQPTAAVGLAILVPPFGATLLFFPLCYLSWFSSGSRNALHLPKLILFWLFGLVFALIWGNIIWASLEQLLR